MHPPEWPSTAQAVLTFLPVVRELLADWNATFASLGLDPTAAQGSFIDLIERYAGLQRHYHNWQHLAAVIRGIRDCRAGAANLSALKLAGYFHDAIYDPRAADNEERSADLAAVTLDELRVTAATIAIVRNLILKTKRHEADDADIDARILLDVDLAILGAAADEYDRYAAAIRREYAWVPEADYRTGRRMVLQRFLDRPHLFRTPQFAGLEAPARGNLAREIAALGAPE